MKLTIITVILGFYCCGCYAYPNRCVCVQNPEVSSSILAGFHPYEQAQGRLEEPEVPEEIQPSLATGVASYVGPRPRKNQLNFQGRLKEPEIVVPEEIQPTLTTGGASYVGSRQRKNLLYFIKPRHSEYELGEYNGDTENRFKQENALRTLLGLFELPKRGNSGEPILRPGQLSPVIIRAGKRSEMSRIEVEERNGGSKEELPGLYTGIASKTIPPIIRSRRRFFRPEIRLPQDITEPKFTAHARDGDYEYEL